MAKVGRTQKSIVVGGKGRNRRHFSNGSCTSSRKGSYNGFCKRTPGKQRSEREMEGNVSGSRLRNVQEPYDTTVDGQNPALPIIRNVP